MPDTLTSMKKAPDKNAWGSKLNDCEHGTSRRWGILIAIRIADIETKSYHFLSVYLTKCQALWCL